MGKMKCEANFSCSFSSPLIEKPLNLKYVSLYATVSYSFSYVKVSAAGWG